MTKADLINLIAEKARLQHKQAETVVNMVFDMMADALRKDDRIEIRGFGSFVNRSYGRMGRNPQTGKEIKIPAMTVPRFRAGKDFKDSLS